VEAAVGQQCSGEAMPSRCAGSSLTRTTLTSRRRTCGRSGLAAGDCCALVEIACSVPDAFDHPLVISSDISLLWPIAS
jgi:hypothetical protein